MNIICRPKGVVGTLRTKRDIKAILDSGYSYTAVDLSVFTMPNEIRQLSTPNFKREGGKVYLTEHPEKLVEVVTSSFIRYAKELKIKLPIAIAPYTAADILQSKYVEADKVNDIMSALAHETIVAAVNAGCERVIVYPLFAGVTPDKEWEVNHAFYKSLAYKAVELGSKIQILLINRPKDINGHLVRGICAEPEQAIGWIDDLNKECGEERFGFCFDLGVATLCGQNVYEVLKAFEKRLKAVIIRDCDGINDVEMLPYTACMRGQQTDWLSFVRALRQLDFDGDFIMDFADTYGQMPDMMGPAVLKLSNEIAEDFCWHIGMTRLVKKHDKRVLFGAGNMCRAYMKDYGRDYPPLFTCDNNSSRWGETFEGLTVEPPEKLRDISPDTAIYICNVYYNEITAQIKEMGLPNPVEWFCDLYMDSFYMDRLDMAKNPFEGK